MSLAPASTSSKDMPATGYCLLSSSVVPSAMSMTRTRLRATVSSDRVPKQAGALVVIRDAQSDGQRIRDERVVDRSQKEDSAEKESEFSVVLFAERAARAGP